MRKLRIRRWKKSAISLVPRLPLILTPVILWLTWVVVSFQGLAVPEALDYAQVARHVSRGDGFVTSAVTPLSLVVAPRLENHPSLFHAPGFVLWEAFWFRVSGARDTIAALASGSAWVLAFWLLYGFAVALFGREVALFAVALFVVNLLGLRFSTSGLPHFLAAAFLVALLWVLSRARTQAAEGQPSMTGIPWRIVVASGVLAAALGLCDYAFLGPVAGAMLLFWARWPHRASINPNTGVSPRRGSSIKDWVRQARRVFRQGLWLKASGVFLLVFLATLAPWAIRNVVVAGHPLPNPARLDMVTGTPTYPGNTLYRQMPSSVPSPWSFVVAHPLQTGRKLLRGAERMAQDLPGVLGVLVLSLFVLGCLRPPEGDAGRLQRYLLLIAACYAVSICVSTQRSDRMLALLPAIAAFAASALARFLGRAGSVRPADAAGSTWWIRKRAWPFWGAVLLVAVPLVFDRVSDRQLPALEANANVAYLANTTEKGATIVTDAPWLVAWHADRTALWFPHQEGDFLRIQKEMGSVEWIYFTRYRGMLGPADVALWWVKAFANTRFETFKDVKSKVIHEKLLRRGG